eukprot:224740-Chlamydomonas_euryale.AAC.1
MADGRRPIDRSSLPSSNFAPSCSSSVSAWNTSCRGVRACGTGGTGGLYRTATGLEWLSRADGGTSGTAAVRGRSVLRIVVAPRCGAEV